MPEPVPQRIVPGAPPPVPLSKTQKKKRKANKPKDADSPIAATDAAAAVVLEKAPEPIEVQEPTLAPEAVPSTENPSTPLPEEEILLKPSPIVDLVHKRLKATSKKIQRIAGYAATDSEKLNDDQKRIIKTLPALEAIQKELGEVKKAIEVHESELVHELAAKRVETEKAEKARIAQAVSAAEAKLVSKTADILNLLRLRGAEIPSFITDSVERTAIYAATDALLGDDVERKHTVLNGFLFDTGKLDGISYSRITEITQLVLNPPRAPTPDEPIEEEQEDPIPAESNAETEPEVPVSEVPNATTSNSFHFIQESELVEAPSLKESAEWVSVEPQEHNPEVVAPTIETEAVAVNGLVSEDSLTPAPAQATLNWADSDDSGLPPIADVQAEFKASGSATPAEVEAPEAVEPVVNGTNHVEAPHRQEDDDGFTTQARGGRGRGGRGGHRGHGGHGGRGFRGGERGGYHGHRGGDQGGFRGGEHHGGFRGGDRGEFRGGDRGEHHGGFRGGDRGEFRGGDRGEFRGGDRGEFRGGDRGEFRGGDRGETGGFRGGDRGGYRRGDRGGYRGHGGDWRGDGERGRGRGRGRGGERGGPYPAPAPATPA
ncbi:hypothetical protein K443DRAFT_671049 [Laccaria amethystina LaAM-08-1]|uniref:Uncharacterized protein n=1 Tax=Laccaria amethystina LaAM-08-1 TaxID=1095629 RepID=A0A0C9XBV2_9AGAR|nr:hypothetical protein K443DRAFT_671049 [Laccaria amethystina LaAM-08-1]